ncbi:serine/threonine-protein kinase 11-interacting protein-like isoform X1 [Ipomoea triloba]|uniref:serine/threonine-protein kinase 11-interacting protein-like isoform X1 n=1 Tax=Ipomoea triloba TaxID=35885 RepID=UPI00125CF934|nr:serine/threonine-protein kinase 11-interacting protein-like isoform X1 [Ipomoea triloba]
MAIVTGDWYLDALVKFVESHAELLIEGTLVLKLNPVGLHYVHSRLEALAELESLLAGAPVDYFRAYVSDLGDHRALEQLRRILCHLTSLKVFSVLPPPARDPSPLSLLPFTRLKVLELRGCDLSTSAAKGLLQLRQSLEKLICHNSTDALRHVFASRIADIKDSPQWNRLWFVSCACNGLLLMDESLQLLPAVETLDLSRNKFSRVDNLRKCTRLKHLDIGFNHLRTVAAFSSEVSSHIVKLVLRNNALTTLRGIENLKSLEGLDLSNNIISNFFEIEILGGLSSLQNLWLQGNPLCCARWYRAQVLSFFTYPDKLKLDEKKHTKSDIWKRQILIARRQRRPASFGFYSPARDDAEPEGIINTKKKKVPRFVSINDAEESTCLYSDDDSVSFVNEIHNKEKNAISYEESGIVDLMNRIEFIKKENNGLWLQEFKDWIDCDSCVVGVNSKGTNFKAERGKERKGKMRGKQNDESSRYVSNSVQFSGEDGNMEVLDSDTFFAETSLSFSEKKYTDQISETESKIFVGHVDGNFNSMKSTRNNQENVKILNDEVLHSGHARISPFDSSEFSSLDNSFTTIPSFSTTLDASHGSPPHYKEDILYQRHNLEEEFLQLSSEPFFVASSDTDTSSSKDDSVQYGEFISPKINF